MKKIKWGILGGGHIAEKFLDDFHKVPHAEVVALVSKSEEKRNRMAQKYNIPKTYSRYEDFAADSEIDAVYIATANTMHFENAKLCLENKKAVLCEKPMTVNAIQMKELQNAAIQNNTLLMEAVWTYFLPTILQAKKWIEEGKIGDVKMIKADFGFNAPANSEGRIFNPQLAGGALLDIGIYPLAFAQFFSSSETLKTESLMHLGKTGVDEYNTIHKEYADGSIAVLTSSVLFQLTNEGTIYGTKGQIKLPFFWRGTLAILTTETETITFEDKRETWGYDFETVHFTDLFLNNQKQSPVVSFETSKKLVESMDEIRNQHLFKYPFE